MRKLSDGTIVAPRRGRPPAVPDGYERDPGDPFIFLPVLPNCDYRITELVKTGCCEKLMRWCDAVDKTIITRGICSQCQGDIEWAKENLGK